VAGLPTVVARELEVRPEKHQWLIEGLWSDDAVGIIGGEPKCCKSFLALDVAVAVATGQPCLDRFAVARRGRVLLYAAEDALHVVRARLQGIALARGTTLDQLDIHVITVPSLRLDIEQDCARYGAGRRGRAPRAVAGAERRSAASEHNPARCPDAMTAR